MENSMSKNELKELELAARTIVSFKKANLDASTLDELRREIHRNAGKHHQRGGPRVHHGTSPPRVIRSTKKVDSPRSRNIEHETLPEITPFSSYILSPNIDKRTWRRVCNYRPPEIPPVPRVRGLIKTCSKPFEKQLTESDIKENQSRLSLNKAYVEEYLIPMLKEDEDPREGINVTTYDSEGTEFGMVYKSWSSDKSHVLSKGWKEFCLMHELRMLEDFVTVWAFRNRFSDNLCFVITSRRLPVFHLVRRSKN